MSQQQPTREEIEAADRQYTHGGKREGAGRPTANDKKVKIWFSVPESRQEEFQSKIKDLHARLMRIYTRSLK